MKNAEGCGEHRFFSFEFFHKGVLQHDYYLGCICLQNKIKAIRKLVNKVVRLLIYLLFFEGGGEAQMTQF